MNESVRTFMDDGDEVSLAGAIFESNGWLIWAPNAGLKGCFGFCYFYFFSCVTAGFGGSSSGANENRAFGF